MKGPWLFAAGLLILAVLAGCATTGTPDWVHPGTAQAQQARAQRYDPYPQTEIGPPMSGDRPRDYDQSPPEPSRARWQLGNWGQ
jgi:hypothetical protein